MDFFVQNLKELPKVAKEIKKHLIHKIIIFEGKMGVGKTTFIKELVKSFGTNDEVSSPTFSIVNEYDTNEGKVFHFDFYRINHENEALDFGIEDYIYSNQFCLMEWSNKIANFIPNEHHSIFIKNIDGIRYINFE